MVILAEIVMFLPKVVYFGRNKTISAEIRQIWPNIRFRPNFGFCEGPVSVFGVSAKNMFRSNTSVRVEQTNRRASLNQYTMHTIIANMH